MRLTPADVHNVAFKKPSIGKRGYDEDEVDAFLDLIEAELARLIEENNELTQRAGTALAVADSAETGPIYADQPVQPVTAQPVPAGPTDHHDRAARLLGLAQETADKLTAEAAQEAEETRAGAKAESEKLLGDAHAESERLLTDARNESERVRSEATTESEKMRGDAKAEAEKLLTDAKNQSEQTVTEASGRAEALERDSRVRAEAMDREAQNKYNQVMGSLTEQRTTLEKKVDDLRVYEREYRGRLKSWITEQLDRLGDGTGSADSSNGGTRKADVTDAESAEVEDAVRS